MAKRKIVPAILMLTLGMVLMTRSAQANGPQAGESKQLVTWELELAGGVKAKLTAANGELVRLTREDGSELAFIPEVVVGGPTKFKVFEVIPAAGGGNESLRPIDVMEVGPGEEAYSKKVSGLTVRLAQGAPGHSLEGAPVKAAEASPSDMLVRWNLTLPSGRVVKVVSREGEMTRVKLSDGQFFGFVPMIREEGAVSFRLFSLKRVQGVGEALSPIETFDVQPGADYFPSALSSSLVKLTDVRKISPADREALSKLMSGTPGGGLDDQCCVTCGGTKVCGCSVVMDCGSCCSPPCCFEDY